MMEFNIFDILYVKTNVNTSAKSHVQQIERPVVVIQNDSGNKFAPTLIVMCLTSKIKKVDQPTHGVIKASKSNEENNTFSPPFFLYSVNNLIASSTDTIFPLMLIPPL